MQIGGCFCRADRPSTSVCMHACAHSCILLPRGYAGTWGDPLQRGGTWPLHSAGPVSAAALHPWSGPGPETSKAQRGCAEPEPASSFFLWLLMKERGGSGGERLCPLEKVNQCLFPAQLARNKRGLRGRRGLPCRGEGILGRGLARSTAMLLARRAVLASPGSHAVQSSCALS